MGEAKRTAELRARYWFTVALKLAGSQEALQAVMAEMRDEALGGSDRSPMPGNVGLPCA